MDDREKIVQEAMSWRGTPYHPHARAKGAGCDCLTFIAGVYIGAGLIPPMDIPHYSQQWHLHRNRELYVEGLLAHGMKEIGYPSKGDVAVWKFGRTFSHGAIVFEWPTRVMQSVTGRAVTEGNPDVDAFFRDRPVRFFSLFEV